jgi:hypothetical protein
MLLSIVLPSLVIMVPPFPLRIILSIPRGPSDVLMASATAATGQHSVLQGVPITMHTSGGDDVRGPDRDRLLLVLSRGVSKSSARLGIEHGVSTLNVAFPPVLLVCVAAAILQV